jgi:hypothetical protein
MIQLIGAGICGAWAEIRFSVKRCSILEVDYPFKPPIVLQTFFQI